MILVIGNKNYSSWSMRPWLAMRQFDVEFEETRLSLDSPGFATDIAAYSAAGKVPVLVHQDLSVWDSLAICEYVAELHRSASMWPADDVARAQARAVSAEMHSGFSSLRRQLPMNCRATGRTVELEESTRTAIQRIETIWTQCLTSASHAGPYLFGKFSIADAMYAPVVSRFSTYGIELGEVARDYMAVIRDLPAYRDWLREATAEPEELPQEEIGL
jgi:glutathione S-transferase